MPIPPLAAGAVALAGYFALKRILAPRARPEIIQAKLAAGALVVDVRTPTEFQRGAFPGAVNVPLSEISSRLPEIPKDRGIVLYCASGARSAAAARVFKQAGYPDVVNAGGLHDMPRQG